MLTELRAEGIFSTEKLYGFLLAIKYKVLNFSDLEATSIFCNASNLSGSLATDWMLMSFGTG